MKKLIIAVSLLLIPYSYTFAQKQTSPKNSKQKVSKLPLPESTIKDFAYNAQYQFKYGTGSFPAVVVRHFSRLGYELPDIAVKMENLQNNFQDLNEVLKIFKEYGGDRTFVFSNISSLGVSATNAKIITDYLFSNQ